MFYFNPPQSSVNWCRRNEQDSGTLHACEARYNNMFGLHLLQHHFCHPVTITLPRNSALWTVAAAATTAFI